MLKRSMQGFTSLEQLLSRTQRRLRAQRALNALVWSALCFAAALIAYAILQYAQRAERLPPLTILPLILLLPLLFALWPVSREDAAQRIDTAHDNADRVRAALDFASRKAETRSRFMEAAIRDAVARAADLSPERAVPWTFPRALRFVPIALALLAVVLLIPERALPVRRPKPTTQAAQLLTPDDLDAFRADLRGLLPLPEDPDGDALRKSYEKLLDQIARGETTKAEAIEKLLALEKKLNEAGQLSRDDGQGLSDLAKELGQLDEALKKALEKQDAGAAARELKRIAAEMHGADKAELSRLREALRNIETRVGATDKRKQKAEELKSLLKREQEKPEAQQDKQLLKRKKRELDELERELKHEREKNRELERLDRDLADASRAMNGQNQDQAERSMQDAANDMQRFSEQQRTDEQRDALANQVSQLRQLMQQQRNSSSSDEKRQDGGDKASLEQRFVQRAHGEQGDAQQNGQQGGPSDSKNDGSPSSREGQDGEGATLLKPTGEGQTPDMLMQLPGSESVVRQSAGGSSGAAREHDPRTLKKGTDLESTTSDSQVSGTLGKGPSRSETILDAADRGFVSTGYRKVYTEYRGHAEEVLEKDEIPTGYRFYVRRYFQLIRPRDER